MLKNALLNNLKWFANSGVMLPNDGLWGVAERVAVTQGNSVIDEMKAAFQAWTDYDGYCVIEQRRADCNFEAAYMYLIASQALKNPEYHKIAVNILDFLYFRSGLLERNGTQDIKGSWNWSHIKRRSVVYFDDDAWCVFIQLEIAAAFPELDKRYEMSKWAMILADELLIGARRVFDEKAVSNEGHWYDKTGAWQGRLNLPHWGSLVCMALGRAWKENHKEAYLAFIRDYHQYLRENIDIFNASEIAYSIIGASNAYKFTGIAKDLELAKVFGKRLVARIDINGNIPAEHFETPTGPHLVDTIYTVNWALVGLQMLCIVDNSFKASFDKVLSLILKIQDNSPEPQFAGCWRGMYDMHTHTWGGGDRYEGGASSIYTGWTNAPISIVIGNEILANA